MNQNIKTRDLLIKLLEKDIICRIGQDVSYDSVNGEILMPIIILRNQKCNNNVFNFIKYLDDYIQSESIIVFPKHIDYNNPNCKIYLEFNFIPDFIKEFLTNKTSTDDIEYKKRIFDEFVIDGLNKLHEIFESYKGDEYK